MKMIFKTKKKRILCALTVLLTIMILIIVAPMNVYAASNNPLRMTVKQTFSTSSASVDDTFRYRLRPLQANNPMPAGSTAAGYTFMIAGNNEVTLGPVNFTKQGLYQYELYQVIETAKINYTYDRQVYTIQVHVDSALNVIVIVLNANGAKAANIEFYNSYTENYIPPTTPGPTAPPTTPEPTLPPPTPPPTTPGPTPPPTPPPTTPGPTPPPTPPPTTPGPTPSPTPPPTTPGPTPSPTPPPTTPEPMSPPGYFTDPPVYPTNGPTEPVTQTPLEPPTEPTIESTAEPTTIPIPSYEPGGDEQDTPPNPSISGHTLVPYEDGFIELDENGTPIGVWKWDDDTEMWVFEEDVPTSGWTNPISKENPKTGDDSNMSLYNKLFASGGVVAIIALVYLLMGGKGKQRKRKSEE